MTLVSPSTGAAPKLRGAATAKAALCLHCGSILDAPRLEPVTRALARKCMSCLCWQPVGGS
ncbi:hypothetical protein BH20ACT19_BH20ACT19_01630 [soil metagenome]